jgi:hypothetical protein
MNESENPFERDHERVLFTVSREVAQAAIAQVASCEECNPDAAEFQFEWQYVEGDADDQRRQW